MKEAGQIKVIREENLISGVSQVTVSQSLGLSSVANGDGRERRREADSTGAATRYRVDADERPHVS